MPSSAFDRTNLSVMYIFRSELTNPDGATGIMKLVWWVRRAGPE